jgi:hypothetical protein
MYEVFYLLTDNSLLLGERQPTLRRNKLTPHDAGSEQSLLYADFLLNLLFVAEDGDYIQGARMKSIQNKMIISQKVFIIHIYELHHYKRKLSKFFLST